MSYIGNNPKVNSLTFTPQSADIGTPSDGMIEVSNGTVRSKGAWLYQDSAWSKIGSGASLINYISSNDGSSLTGWSTYADAVGTSPVDGTGGSPTTTWGINTTTPLRGAADFVLTKDAANRQGEGVAYDFTIDKADYATPLGVEFRYIASSNFSYANGDVKIFIYSKDGSALIPVTPNTLDGSGKFVGEFQTEASPNNDYRLIFHIATTNANAWTLNIDDISVYPSQIQLGDGSENMVVGCDAYKNGNQTGVNPNGNSVKINIDATTKDTHSAFDTSNYKWVCKISGWYDISASINVALTNVLSDQYMLVIYKNGAAFIYGNLSVQTANKQFIINCNGKKYLNVGDYLELYFYGAGNNSANTLTVVGNASSTFLQTLRASGLVGDGTETRIVAMATYLSTSQAVNASNYIKYDTKIYDTHSGYSSSTGLYTSQISGIYKISVVFQVTVACDIYLYKNGSIYSRLVSITSASNCFSASMDVQLNVGDTFGIVTDTTTTFNGSSNKPTILSISRISGPSTIAAAEKIYAKYTITASSSNISIAAGADEIIDYDTKMYDSHNAVTTGASWNFKAPRSTVYHLTAMAQLVSVADTKGTTIYISINGSGKEYLDNRKAYGSTALDIVANDDIYLNANDILSLLISNGDTSARNLGYGTAGSPFACISIHSI